MQQKQDFDQNLARVVVFPVPEMEKRADGADASVLFFLLGCANSLAVYAQIRSNTVLISVLTAYSTVLIAQCL